MLRFWTLRRADGVPGGSPVPAIALAATLWLAVWAGIDWWDRQPAPQPYAEGVPVLAWYALAVLALAGLVRGRSTPSPAFGAAVALAIGLLPPALLLAALDLWADPRWFWGAAVLLALYVPLYLARGLHALTGARQRAAALAGSVLVLAFAWLSDFTAAVPDVWLPAETAAVSDQELADRETALFEQSDRIDRALQSVERDASPRPQAFFVGFAGVGAEKVFAQEIGLASRVIGERYGSAARQILLINDERDLESQPLASVSGLSYALQGLGSTMKTDRDVLFLAISSHGSSDPSIAVANAQMPFTDLTPEDLADALRDAGIQWRVILVSACYAGGFIEPLRDARTIVITAAAPDRTSFGCSSDSDLTYFGEAFYRDALPDATSLRDAFEKAKTAIAARERDEGETPSNPQAFFGTEIEAHLDAMRSADPAR